MKIWREDDDDWYCSDTLKGHGSTVWGVDFNEAGDLLGALNNVLFVTLLQPRIAHNH